MKIAELMDALGHFDPALDVVVYEARDGDGEYRDVQSVEVKTVRVSQNERPARRLLIVY